MSGINIAPINASNPLGIPSLQQQAMTQTLSPTGITSVTGSATGSALTDALSAVTQGIFGAWSDNVSGAITNAQTAGSSALQTAQNSLANGFTNASNAVSQTLASIPATIETDITGLTKQWGASVSTYISKYAIEGLIALIIIVAIYALLEDK